MGAGRCAASRGYSGRDADSGRRGRLHRRCRWPICARDSEVGDRNRHATTDRGNGDLLVVVEPVLLEKPEELEFHWRADACRVCLQPRLRVVQVTGLQRSLHTGTELAKASRCGMTTGQGSARFTGFATGRLRVCTGRRPDQLLNLASTACRSDQTRPISSKVHFFWSRPLV